MAETSCFVIATLEYLKMSKFPFIALSLLVVASLHAASERQWEKLEGCTLGDTKYADGDSFHVKHDGKDLIIRLYFVDAPEDTADQRYPARIADQAKYFGISSPEVLKVGDAAQSFTAKTLGAAPFTVFTCGQDAMGASKQQRLYGIVETKQGNLAELLVKNGLARIYGNHVTMPDGMDGQQYEGKLLKLEQEAKQKKVGGWAKAQ